MVSSWRLGPSERDFKVLHLSRYVKNLENSKIGMFITYSSSIGMIEVKDIVTGELDLIPMHSMEWVVDQHQIEILNLLYEEKIS